MIVVLDTNAFVHRLHLLRNGIGPLFLHFLRSRQGHLFVPDILSQEYREQAVTLVRDSGAEIDGKFARIHAIVGEIVEYTIPSDEEVTTAVQARLQELAFLSIGQPLTEAILLAAGRRSLDKKRPCTKTDHGYKDCLIWESILCLAPGSEVHLVTKDQGFYDGEHLAAGLRDEAEQRQLRVTAHKELEQVLKALQVGEPPLDVATVSAALHAALGSLRDKCMTNWNLNQLGPGIEVSLVPFFTESIDRIYVDFTEGCTAGKRSLIPSSAVVCG